MQDNTYINDTQWSKLFAFFKGIKNLYVKDESSLRVFLNGVFWMMRTGAQWRELPKEFGKWNSVFSRFNSWSIKGIWESMFKRFSNDPDLQSIMLDSSVIRAHASSAGHSKNSAEKEGLGRSCGGFSSKIHVLVDGLGNPLKFILSPGEEHDINYAKNLLDGFKDCAVLADKGYDSNDFLLEILTRGCKPVIPPKKNRIYDRPYNKEEYKERHLVECFFSKIKYFRRIFSRFDKLGRNFLSFLYLAGSHVWLR